MDIKKAFEILRDNIGTDEACGHFVHLHPKYYEALRNGRYPLPSRTAELIILKAREVEARQRDCTADQSLTEAPA